MADNLFSYDPMVLQQQRQAALNQQASDFASLGRQQQADMLGYKFGNAIGGGLGSLMGVQDQGLVAANAVNSVVKETDLTDPESLKQAALKLGQMGYKQAGEEMFKRYQDSLTKAATLAQTTAQTNKLTKAADLEDKLRSALAALPPDATDADVEKILIKYGKPEDVLKLREQQATKRAEAEQRVKMAQDALQAKLEMAREQGANRAQIAQMMIEGKKDIALLTASLKPPSAAELKMQEKKDKEEKAREGVSTTLDRASTLVTQLEKSGGMPSTAKSGLSNVMASAGTGTVGQAVGRILGTKDQASRDELNSLRLQLLNDIKDATGMTGGQLNSNVELQTWLSSLGGPGMTKEANLNIIRNIENKYGKGAAGGVKTGTKENPIVLK